MYTILFQNLCKINAYTVLWKTVPNIDRTSFISWAINNNISRTTLVSFRVKIPYTYSVNLWSVAWLSRFSWTNAFGKKENIKQINPTWDPCFKRLWAGLKLSANVGRGKVNNGYSLQFLCIISCLKLQIHLSTTSC